MCRPVKPETIAKSLAIGTPADGYYALSQFLSIDNLREDSFAYLKAWARKYLLRH